MANRGTASASPLQGDQLTAYEAAGETITLNRKDRNLLVLQAVMHCGWAAEAFNDYSYTGGYTQEAARAACADLQRLIPLREALGWKIKETKKTAKGKDEWELPGDLLADCLSLFIGELRKDLPRDEERLRRALKNGDLEREALGREALARTNHELDRLLKIQARLEGALGAPVVELSRKERNLLSSEADLRMGFIGDGLTGNASGLDGSAAATVIGRLKPLRDCIGWECDIGKKEGKGRRWQAPADVLLDAVTYLIDERRGDVLGATATIESFREGEFEAEAEEREQVTRMNGILTRLLDIASKAGGRS